MYKAFYKNAGMDYLFYDMSLPAESVRLLDGIIGLEAGGAGSFTFSLAPNNAAYDELELLNSYIDVYRSSEMEPFFSGRVTGIKKNFEMIETVTCEGCLALFNDSVYRPEEFNGELRQLVLKMIDSHNDQMTDPMKQIQVRTITVEDEYLFRAYENVETTWERLKDLQDSYGGYMSVSRSGGRLYFDWVADIDTVSGQMIDFGQNLIDLTQETGATDIITAIIPLGAEIEDEITKEKHRLTIADVNSGRDYLENAAAIAEFGRIYGVAIFDDVTVATNLKSKGQDMLQRKSISRLSINISAVDLAAINNTEHFCVGTKVRVSSALHGLDRVPFDVLSQRINIIDPTKDTLQLNTDKRGYISGLHRSMKANERRIDKVDVNTEGQKTLAELGLRIIECESSIDANSEQITSTVERIVRLENGIAEAQYDTRIEQNAEQILALVEENNNIRTAFRIDSDGVHIGKGDSSIESLQDNTSYRFIDNEGNTTLLKIDTAGVTAPTVNVTEQFKLSAGGADVENPTNQWAIRLGKASSNRHNLDIVWIGG